MKIPHQIKAALDACPAPHELKEGRSHIKIYIAGRLIGTFNRTGKTKGDIGYAAVAQRIRRAVAE